jgi:hypothetical protein
MKPKIITIPNYDELVVKTRMWGMVCQKKFLIAF